MKKTFLALLLVLVFALTLSACNSGDANTTPTEPPTTVPAELPTEKPTQAPTDGPTEVPSDGPTEVPTSDPTEVPTDEPTEAPTEQPTEVPTDAPTENVFSEGLEFTSNGDGTCYVSGIGTCTDADIIIPTISPEGKIVTSIGSDAFRHCSSLTSIVFGENSQLTSIGSNAFYGCSGLTSITIPDSVTSIGRNAFQSCYKLVEIINKSPLNITADSSNYGGVASYAMEVHNGESKIANKNGYLFYAYDGVNYLLGYVGNDTELVLPENYNSEQYEIYQYAFYDNSITSIIIPDSVAIIGEYAFNDCSSLTSVVFGENIQLASIGDFAFSGCGILMRIVIPDSVTSIGESAFRGCSSLTCVVFGENSQLTSIGNSVFIHCSSLTSIEIPDSVTSIGDFVFQRCSSLTNIEIPNSVTSIGKGAFSFCYKLVEVINKSSLSITAGSSNYGNVAYYAIEVHNGESKMVNKDGYLFYTYDGVNYLLGYLGTDTELTLPENYNGDNYEIYNYAFYGCSSLESIEIPDGVTSIGSYAFSDCSSLTSIEISGGVTSIGSYAFEDCSSLTSIEIPDNVTSIGDWAFYGCSSLANINIGENNIVYSSIDGNLYNKDATKLIQYAIGKTFTSFDIPDSVTSIGESAFYGCSSLTSIEIPDNVTSIGSYAFRGCSSLTSIVIPDGVTSIGWGTFDGCSSLTSVVIPESVGYVDNYAFSGCSSLTIYCEADEQPWGWSSDWNSSNCPVVWGYKAEE